MKLKFGLPAFGVACPASFWRNLYGGGDGKQTRSFLFIDECLMAVRKLMDSENFNGPVNIGSEEMVTINQLAEYAMEIAGKKLTI